MDFTVLGRTPEGAPVCMVVVLKRWKRRPRIVGRGEGDQEKGSEKRELERDMIRLSLVINLSEAVRTFFKSLNLHSKNCPCSPHPLSLPWSYCESLCTKTETGNKK